MEMAGGCGGWGPAFSGHMGAASLTFNVCVVLYAGTQRLLRFRSVREKALRISTGCAGLSRHLREDISKLVTYGLSGLVMNVLVVLVLVSTDVSKQPFVYAGNKEVILVVCAAIAGRHLFLLVLVLYSRHTRQSDRYVTFLHHMATSACYVGMTSYGNNLFLALVLVFMELDHYIYLTLQVVRLNKSTVKNRMVTVLKITGLVTALGARVILPVVCCAVAISRQSPLIMDPGSLGIICFAILFFTVFNIWVVWNWALLVYRRISKLKHKSGSEQGTSIHNELKCEFQPSNMTKDMLLLAKMTKANNVHTVSNLQSNFSNQLWSKTISSVTQIGGTKAAIETQTQEVPMAANV